MLFSIIVPVYNVEKYLDECIESIVKQDFQDYEMILVNDGSTDHSPDICERWITKDKRLRVIHKKNGGLSDARNIGTQAANGDYIVYIDSDDYIGSTNFLSRLSGKIQISDPDVIIYKFHKYYDDQKRLDACSYGFPNLDQYTDLTDKVEYLVKTDSFYCSAWSKAVKRKIITDNQIEFEKGLLGEDQEWYYHILSNVQSLDGIDEAFLVYRQRPNSITSAWKIKNLTDCIYVVSKWAVKINNNEKLDAEYKIALLNSVAKLYCNMLIAYSRFEDSRKREYYGQIRDLEYLLKFDMNPRVHKMNLVKRIVGFHGLIALLTILSKVR